VRLERGEPALALADLDRAAQLSKRRDGVVLHWLAAAQLDLGRTQEALQTQQQAAQLRPDDEVIRQQLRDIEERGR
jgi:hypothetical protein